MDNELFYKEFGKTLKNLRRNVEITQSELSQRVGLSRTSVTNIEKGRQKVPLHFLYIFASALGVEPSDLLPKKDSISQPNNKLSKLLNEDSDLNSASKEWLKRVIKSQDNK